MIEKHACSASCPCQKGRDLAIAEKVKNRVVDAQLAERVALRHFLALEVGGDFFTEHLKLHHFHGSLTITDMTNAGKRGKKVRTLTMVPNSHGNDELAGKVIKHAVNSILHMTYDHAKAALEKVLQDQQGRGQVNLFELHETAVRGIDVEPMGITIKLEKKFPNGTIVSIHASPHEFRVTNSVVISAPGKTADGFRQDTNYWSVGKKDGILFYGWITDNLSHVANMTILDLQKVWDSLGARYDSH